MSNYPTFQTKQLRQCGFKPLFISLTVLHLKNLYSSVVPLLRTISSAMIMNKWPYKRGGLSRRGQLTSILLSLFRILDFIGFCVTWAEFWTLMGFVLLGQNSGH